MATAISLLSAVFVFGLIVFFHELGHFSVAKYVGITVHEFAIGMGPKILKLTRGETDYSIRILPIGGYVKMEGEDEESNSFGSFSQKTVGERIAVIFAGAFMNFVLAIILFVVIFYNLGGAPTTTIKEIIADSPAEIAGIKENDEILTINNISIDSWETLVASINNSNDESLTIEILRSGEKIIKILKPQIDEENQRLVIGIVPHTKKSFVIATKASLMQIKMIMSEMINFFRGLIMREAQNIDVVGPVGIIGLVGEASKGGLYDVLFLAALISVNLGFINLLPIPALDGSRILFLTVELFRGKPMDPEKEAFVHMMGLAILMLLMIMIMYKDIATFFKG